MPLKKNTSLEYKDTQLLIAFKAHFKGFLNLHRIRAICMIINAICKVRSVNFSLLSSGFDNNVHSSSNFRRIQRFFADAKIPMELVSKYLIQNKLYF